MENQINIEDQNATSQQQPTPEKQETNYLLIGGIILICFALFGFGGYYLSKQSSKSNIELNQKQAAPLYPINGVDGDANWNAYKNTQYSFVFNYPKNYVILTKPDCNELIGNQSACLTALSINASNSDYPPTAHFWLLKGINSVRISGQVSSINFDSQKNAWVLNEGISPAQTLSAWDHTKSGQEIIKTSNGGSHGSSNYFLIPNYKYDEIAIFSIPQSFRLRCDNFTSGDYKEIDCNNFYKSIIDKYNEGKTAVDTWLPDNYFNSIYSEAENMVKSYENTISVSNTRYSDLSELKTADVLVQDGSYYGPPFDPVLYQLEISQSNHLFAKSDTINLRQYIGKRIKVSYREVKGIVMGEQQLVIVYSVE